MKDLHPLPPEVGIVYGLRQQFPTIPYSQLLDAFHLARSIMPEGSLENLEIIAAYILEKSSSIEAADTAVAT